MWAGFHVSIEFGLQRVFLSFLFILLSVAAGAACHRCLEIPEYIQVGAAFPTTTLPLLSPQHPQKFLLVVTDSL